MTQSEPHAPVVWPSNLRNRLEGTRPNVASVPLRPSPQPYASIARQSTRQPWAYSDSIPLTIDHHTRAISWNSQALAICILCCIWADMGLLRYQNNVPAHGRRFYVFNSTLKLPLCRRLTHLQSSLLQLASVL